jgi:hypothetical protein
MLSQNTPYTVPPVENRPEMPPIAQQQAIPEYNQQFIESLAQRLMPRLMPEILYHLRLVEPERARSKSFGMSLALAIVSIGVMLPLTAIVLGILTTVTGGGIGPALIGLGVIGLVIVLINILFNYVLFNSKS